MAKIKSILPAIILISALFSAYAQTSEPGGIKEDMLRQHVFFLASDSLKGRETGTLESMNAAAYLSNYLGDVNVTPPADGYLQKFLLTTTLPDRQNSYIKMLTKRGREKFSTNSFLAYSNAAGTAMFEGELIFAGFGPAGISNEHSNSALPDVKGKIVLYSAGSPKTFRQGMPGTWNRSEERKKMEVLLKAGAKALIIVTSIHDTNNELYGQLKRALERQAVSLDPQKSKPATNVFIVTPQIADALTGRKFKWNEAMQAAAETGDTQPVVLADTKIVIKSEQMVNKLQAANVIGIVEGSDSLLKEECIVFVAHYDHIGTGADGKIFNGADDNASGVATLLEVAGLFASLEEKPGRSVLFLFPTAEETGLFGSDFYSRNPIFPMDKTVACINLDMVGRVYEQRDSIQHNSPKQVKSFNGIYTLVNQYHPHLKVIASDACNQLGLTPDFSLPDRFFYSSDHYHFHKNKIPVLNLSTGYSADYHKATDTPDRIRTDKMKVVAQLCFLVGMQLANGE